MTTWSPLASGLLTGKYRNGIPKGSRAELPNYAFLREGLTDKARNAVVAELEDVAKQLGCSLAQLAIAWTLTNANVSSVITGASQVAQLQENLKAAAVKDKITDEVKEKIEAIVGENYN